MTDTIPAGHRSPRSTEQVPPDGLLLPAGTRLLHVGPHKTGTTSLQEALFASRAVMRAQGVRHLGRTRNPAAAVRAVTDQPAPTSNDTPPSIRHWTDLVSEFRRAREPRVVVSSEFFAWAKPDAIERIARDLDGDRLTVVVTLRPLGRILPSQWQQNVQAGLLMDYESWLRRVFDEPAAKAARSFWWLHRHDELIERWQSALGRDHVLAVVVDERDHAMLLRVFEALLGLSDGTLISVRDMSNRSMTLAETEAVRAFNVAAREAGVSRAIHAQAMRFGAAMQMKMRPPAPDEERIDTPRWALDRALEVDREIVAAIEASGVRVVGDLSSLASEQHDRGGAEGSPGPILVPPEVAAEMAISLLAASGLARGATRTGAPLDPAALAQVTTSQLGLVFLHRVWAAGARRIGAVRGRITGRRAPA